MPKATNKQGKNTERVGKGSPPVSAQWKPGQSGNPKGRPKSITLSEAYRRELAKVDPNDAEGRSFAVLKLAGVQSRVDLTALAVLLVCGALVVGRL